MRLIPFSDEEPDKIGTVETRVMRCGHRQTLYVAAQVSEEHLDVEAWDEEFRRHFEESLTYQLDQTCNTRECEKCESCAEMSVRQVLAEMEQARIVQEAAKAAQVKARDARPYCRETHGKTRRACEAVYFRLDALERRLEVLKAN